jgi:hypothetical protein
MRPVAAVAIGVTVVIGMLTRGEADSRAGSLLRAAGAAPPLVCKLPRGKSKLPASRTHGLIQHLPQYPDLSLATPAQRGLAATILAQLVAAAKEGNWRDKNAIARAGYKTRTAVRQPGDRSIHYFHAERSGERRGAFRYDPRRPKALIYANAPGQPLTLVGAMWSMRRGERGPTPAGPILRWHSHLVCVQGNRRGTKPLAGGKCPPGARLRPGSEMLHVWFTGDLRSAYSTSAPEPGLCAAELLPKSYCRRIRRGTEGLEGRAPTTAELTPGIQAAFRKESYRPNSPARLVIFNRTKRTTIRVFRSGGERGRTRSSLTMNGVPVTRSRSIGPSPRGGKTIRIRIGNWRSGLYFVRLRAANGRRGFAPLIVRPRRLGNHRVAVVMPTLTWQAYNLRDDDGDGIGNSWYAHWVDNRVRLGRPFLNRGVPYSFRRFDLPFLRWLHRKERQVDMLSQADVEQARSARELRSAYDLIVFPGHHEYVTAREYNLIEGYRDLGGSLMFLSANNFFWEVVRRRRFITKTEKWRKLGRPEAALIGVQYVASGRRRHRPWVARGARASWLLAETGLGNRSSFGAGGVEIDHTTPASPRNVQVLAEIKRFLGPGRSAQMTYYETARGAKVFAAGAFGLLRPVNRDPVISRLLDNVWERLTTDG